MGWSSSSAIQVDNVTIEKNASDQLQIKGGAVSSSLIQDGTIINADISASAAIAKTKLAALNITNTDVDAAGAIARSKLDFGSGLTDSDIAAAANIAKSKLAALNIADADVAAGAAIVKSKLAALNIVDADIAAGAAINSSKLAHGLQFVSIQTATNTNTGISWTVSGAGSYFLIWWCTDVAAVQQDILLDLNSGAATVTIGNDAGTGGDGDYAGIAYIHSRATLFQTQGVFAHGQGSGDGSLQQFTLSLNTESELTGIKIKPSSTGNKTWNGALYKILPAT